MDPTAPTTIPPPPATPTQPQPVQPPAPQPVDAQTPPNSSPLLKRLVILLSIIVILGTSGIGLYLIWNRFSNNKAASMPVQTHSACPNEKVYTNVTEALLEPEGTKICYIDSTAPDPNYVFPSDIIEHENVRNLAFLSLTGYDLSAMRESLEVLGDLKVLRLKNAQLSTLPQGVEKLLKLEELDLTGNNFTEAIQEEIKQKLPNVKVAF